MNMQVTVEHKYPRLRDLTARNLAVYALIFIGFFIAFRWYPHFLLLDRFINADLGFYVGTWALEPNSLVVGRLAQNDAGGIFSDTMSIGFQGEYTRQFGIGGWLLTVPASLFFGFSAAGISLMVTLVSAFSASIAAGAVMLTRYSLGRIAAVLLGLSLLLPWSVVIARSMYWTIGLKVLPAIILIAMIRSPNRSWPRIFGVAVLTTALAAMGGYEYFTIVGATQLGVIAYYSVSERWEMRSTISRLFASVASILGGFALGFGVHILQLVIREGDFSRVSELQRSVISRTGAGGADIGASVDAAAASTPASVLDTYLAMPIFGVRTGLPLIQQFTVGTLLFAVAVVVIIGLAHTPRAVNRVREQALGIAWFVTLLGPIGWFLLARPHSYIHTFLNFSLWFLPTVPLGLALLWPPMRRGFAKASSHKIAYYWIALTFGALLLFFIYSQITVK